VNYLAEVWLNGNRLGSHEGGHLPFVFELHPETLKAENRLVVRVDGRLAPDRVPPGNLLHDPQDTFGMRSFPDTNFDFYPFCGIHRPVLLFSVPQDGIEDLTVTTDIDGGSGLVTVNVANRSEGATIRCTLKRHGSESVTISSGHFPRYKIKVEQAAFWSPDSPNLYTLIVELLRGGDVYDCYSLPVGIRTIKIEGDTLLLNGNPLFLRGFCRHEDFPVTGRGLVPAVIVKDYNLLHWVGANSFRTSHYPYSDEMMALADRLGFVVIDETPAVGLFFNPNGLEKRQRICEQYIQELIERDKNHPSVIMWSLANEPHSHNPEAAQFFKVLFDLAKNLDTTRPVTLVSSVGISEEAFEFLDVVCINRYYGWYSQSGDLDAGLAELSDELDRLHDRYPKPMILSEFGADALSGWHALPEEMFSEEYQAEFLTRYIELTNTKPYIVGQHVWNMCDFKTSQAVHRVGAMNLKGVFTRDRRPKLAAHRLRELWGKKNHAGPGKLP
jgi:beta-glucuronidase